MNKIIVCTYDEKLLPKKMTDWSVCFDLFLEHDFEIEAWKVWIITSWIKTYIPIWWHSKIFPRSSLPTKYWLMQANSVAIIDPDYRWNYIMQFYNYTDKKLFFPKYSRLAQIEFAPYFVKSWVFWTDNIPDIEFVVDKELFDNFEKKLPSGRWTGWLGSTGV